MNHLAPRLSVTAAFDREMRLLNIHVHQPPGRFGCRIELCPEPVMPDGFVALKGRGSKRSLKGYAPSRWWVRALPFDATRESDYSSPVAVEVT